MARVRISSMKIAFYRFLDDHAEKLNLLNYQFAKESGGDLDRALTWFNRDAKLEDARMHAYLGTSVEYFNFCVSESYFSLQIADGSLIQIHLRADPDGFFDGGSLALVPKPGNGFDYFRLDCEPGDARHFRHNRYHGHFGYNASNMRISLFQFPWPGEFLAFVAHLMSDEKGRGLNGSDFQVKARITGFNSNCLLEDLASVGERYNHCLSLFCCSNGGTHSADLEGIDWEEKIT